MDSVQKQIVMGTLLGKSYLSKPKTGVNYFMTMAPVEDENWFNWKALYLKKFERSSPISQGYWRSKASPMWTVLYRDFYKKLTMKCLDQLNATALATWYLDKGFFISKKRICLRTTSFGKKGNNLIKQFFTEVGLGCDVRKERDTGRIVFTKEGTLNFLKIIAPKVPKFLYYRLEEKEPFYNEYRKQCQETL